MEDCLVVLSAGKKETGASTEDEVGSRLLVSMGLGDSARWDDGETADLDPRRDGLLTDRTLTAWTVLTATGTGIGTGVELVLLDELLELLVAAPIVPDGLLLRAT